jgi:uncharacterized protein
VQKQAEGYMSFWKITHLKKSKIKMAEINNLKLKLQTSLKDAIKEKKEIKRDTIRSILSAIQYLEINNNSENINDEDIYPILKSELKKRSEELDFALKAERTDQVNKIKVEEEVIKSFLPQPLTEFEIKNFVSDKIESGEKNMGSLMKLLQENFPGRIDGKLASATIKSLL